MPQTPLSARSAPGSLEATRAVRRALTAGMAGAVLAGLSAAALAAGGPVAVGAAGGAAGVVLALLGGGRAWKRVGDRPPPAPPVDGHAPVIPRPPAPNRLAPGTGPSQPIPSLSPSSLPPSSPQLSPPALRGLFEDGPIGIAVLADDGRVVESNAAFRDLAMDRSPGNEAGKADGRSGGAICDRMAAQSGEGLAERLTDPAPGSLDVTFGREDERCGTLFLGPPESGRRVLHLIETTHQKKLEVQFAQSQRMLAVGKLAGGIAHDFNNLLTAMTGFCDLLLLRHTPGDPSFADIMQIKQNANRAANLVRQLLAFSRQQTLQPRVLTLADVIADLSSLLRRLIGAGITLRVEHGASVAPVRVDRVQLEQVLINLAVNARDAMAGQGELTISSRDVRPDQVNDPPRQPPLPAGRWVLIEVRDSGTGIPARHLDRIFEPFFTTKPVGEGTGLGLSTVYGIVKQTDGYIYAENAPEGGAVVSVYLPAHDGAAEAVDAAASNPSDLTGQGAVLLVEDEDPVRLFAARALRSKGYRVTEARTGLAAVALLEQATEPFDLLITDVVMPEMDGPALIERVRANWPQTRVICISGYAEGAFRDKLSEFDDVRFLAKPFSLQELAGKVKDVLAA
ncbi:MAG: response regulator [Alphaproteobacteria bacterium]|nr:response regulator [Alphaproteobacteria bacterium]